MMFRFLYCYYFVHPSHDLEEERTNNATKTLNLLLTNYDKRLRPKFGGNYVHYYVDCEGRNTILGLIFFSASVCNQGSSYNPKISADLHNILTQR